MTWRALPLLETVLFVLVGMVWRAWLQVRRTGSTGIMLFRGGAVQALRDAGILLLVTAFLAQAVAVLAGWLDAAPPSWAVVGTLLVVVGTTLMVMAQLDMGASWRVGIDETSKPGLVTTRWYAFCRHPIYLFMFVVFAGLALQLPTIFSAALFAGLCVGVAWQVRYEEAFLERTYGEEFRAYARRVGRFLPWIGRLTGGPSPAPGSALRA